MMGTTQDDEKAGLLARLGHNAAAMVDWLKVKYMWYITAIFVAIITPSVLSPKTTGGSLHVRYR